MCVEYETVVTMTQHEIDKGEEVTIEQLKTEIRERFKKICKQNKMKVDDAAKFDNDTEDDGEKALSTTSSGKGKYKKQFKGRCNICGKMGHKSADCWQKDKQKADDEKNNNSNGSGPGKKPNYCLYCRKRGHHIGEQKETG